MSPATQRRTLNSPIRESTRGPSAVGAGCVCVWGGVERYKLNQEERSSAERERSLRERQDETVGEGSRCFVVFLPPYAPQSQRRSREGGKKKKGSARHLRDVSLLAATGNCLPTDRSLTDDQKHIVSFPHHRRRRCLYPSHWPAGCFPVSNRGEAAGCIVIITSTA